VGSGTDPWKGVDLPLFVVVPESLTMREVQRAIEICMRLGLLGSKAGYVLIPPGVTVEVPYQSEAERA